MLKPLQTLFEKAKDLIFARCLPLFAFKIILFDLGEEVNIILPEWKGSQKRVFKIYSNNVFGNGVFLKMSRFNHACKPNAEAFWNEENGHK